MKLQLSILIALLTVVPVHANVEAQSPETPPKTTKWTVQEVSSNSFELNGITFIDTVSGGLKAAGKVNKPLFVYMKKDTCPHCVKFEKKVLSEPKVAKYLAKPLHAHEF